MARKFNTKNLKKLVERTVLFVALLAILYFAYLWIREDSVMQAYSSGIDGCSTGMESCYAIWHQYLTDYRNAQVYSGFFGFIMPVLFYLGKMLVNYIYPEVRSAK